MTDRGTAVSSNEVECRRWWYQSHAKRYECDTERAAQDRAKQLAMAADAGEALAVRDALLRTGDAETFRDGMQAWGAKPGRQAFNGFAGQMFVNLLVKRSPDRTLLSDVLGSALLPPDDAANAGEKLRALADYVESIRVGAHPAPAHSTFLLSYFWALSDHASWPVMWSSAWGFLEFITGESLPVPPDARYLAFCRLVGDLDTDPERFERVASWWNEEKPAFVAPILVDRCGYGLEIEDLRQIEEHEGRAQGLLPGPRPPHLMDQDWRTTPDDRPDGQPNVDSRSAAIANATALVGAARHLGIRLAEDVSAAAGRSLRTRKPSKWWAQDRPRADLWVDWTVDSSSGLGIRLWVNHLGMSIGLRPGWVREGWFDEAAEVLERAQLPGFRLLAARGSRYGEDVGYVAGVNGEFVYARWYDQNQLDGLDLREEVRAVAAAVQPVLDELVTRAIGEEPPDQDDPLAPLVEEFRAGRHYPTPADEEHKAERERFAALLAPESVPVADVAELRRIWNTGRYGGPGPQSNLNVAFRDTDLPEYERIIDVLRYLCWGEGDDAERIDEVLSGSTRTVRGLGESVVMKLLAICHPNRYLPVFPYGGPKGKLKMLQLLGLDEPPAAGRGRVQVEANDRLRRRLDRFFPGDPWGMTQFLYWYAERDDEPVVVSDVDPLEEAAEELLVDRAFLDDIVALLEDKKQVIFYGPPGTGKTYLARKLAEALVPDPTRRSLVQFHPSTSYEDFFEGYRPEVGPDGQMAYRLVPGPLAEIARRASEAPGKRHLMIIDEVNRANLPKVLGELLFLFEYRDEQVRTLYRPDDGFQLPEDLWFIGTMNTADRSIALVDAALRRRFHFVPFFPGQGLMADLLGKWLDKHGGPDTGWVAELVAMVNDELADALGGPHLQLGPSYFMKEGLDVDGLRRIWRYNIEPFIEDQFFGDPAQVDHFRFPAVFARHQQQRADQGPAGGEDHGGGLAPGERLGTGDGV